ncbi:glucose-specific phosphotransferase system IIA component [Geomicrobium halophilum]|uniref:Glucose-specific phosphotransferase system IIA component n=1 Tax=Geomicrobium halophilum TaxID=549000 RepID=A0A841PJK7_9BACL|nr:PTS glucose transporter subunit IIA [Geomicrobium halophilum]MBB6448960.1 glucose-specific phosphotransferase system IIA component [Geomicrobium halophilum]
MIKRILSKLFERSGYIDVLAIANGSFIELADVNNSAISHEKLGPGFAIDPKDGNFVSPVKGTITSVFPTKHAVIIQTKEGLEVLIHVGLDTVYMQGEGFLIHVAEGDTVKVGDRLITADLDKIRDKGISPISVVIFLEPKQLDELSTIDGKSHLVAAETIAAEIKMKEESEEKSVPMN